MANYLIIDGNSFLYSSYFVSKKIKKPIMNGTVFFFLKFLVSLIKKNDYQKVLIAFDRGGGFLKRKLLFTDYKVNRPTIPKELILQKEIMCIILKGTNLSYWEDLDYEADDLIASFVKKLSAEDNNNKFDIFTRDKDLLQLVKNNVHVLRYTKGLFVRYNEERFCKEYTFLPENIIDYLSLLGDKADNIKGISGIGIVRSKFLINKFQTIEQIYNSLEKISKKLKKMLENGKEKAVLNKKIISLNRNIDIPSEICNLPLFSWEKFKNNSVLRKFCFDNNFRSILKLLSKQPAQK